MSYRDRAASRAEGSRPTLHYFSFYLGAGMDEGREQVPAGYAKVEYIKRVAIGAGLNLRLVSTALAKPDVGLLGQKVVKVSGHETHVYLSTLRLSRLTIPFMWLQMLRYFLTQVRKGDVVLVYHSLNYMFPLSLVRRLKRFRLVLEFNDLYHAVSPSHRKRREAEDSFIRSADAYLVMNRIAARAFAGSKSHLLSFGTYDVPERVVKPFEDGRTHVVYAGIIEPSRRAAELAARAAVHLNESFVVHVLGFGDPSEVLAFRQVVAEVNDGAGREAVVFRGAIRGREFSDFLHRCHIGLSTHAYTATDQASADYTFPSKIPTYMAHDLLVVSPAIPCVVDSPFAEFTSFYHAHTPEAIATAILQAAGQVASSHCAVARSPATLVAELDEGFREGIGSVLEVK